MLLLYLFIFFFFQAEDGIRDWSVIGVQTCALPIFAAHDLPPADDQEPRAGLLHFGEHVGREDDGAVLSERPDQAADLDALVRVEPLGRLVEQDRKSVV